MNMRLCVACKKNHPAVSYERNVGGEVTVEHYCFACYEKRFLSVEVDGHENGKTYDVCPYCGRTADEVKSTALVGCARCYRTLGTVTVPMVVRMQQGQADAHSGKKSENADLKTYYKNRKKELLALLMHYSNLGEAKQVEKYKQETERLERRIAAEGYDGDKV